MNQTLSNHAYVNFTLVDNGVLMCHTDLMSCCTSAQGIHRGSWYFPDGQVMKDFGDIYMTAMNRKIVLNHMSNVTLPSGIYRCDIPTVADHDANGLLTDTVYLGLYYVNGGDYCSPAAQNLAMKLA